MKNDKQQGITRKGASRDLRAKHSDKKILHVIVTVNKMPHKVIARCVIT